MSPCPECDAWLLGLIVDFMVGFWKGFLFIVAALCLLFLCVQLGSLVTWVWGKLK